MHAAPARQLAVHARVRAATARTTRTTGKAGFSREIEHLDPKHLNSDYNYMHNKIVACDDRVITGSFNFSRNATMNAENLIVIKSKLWADKYAAYVDGLVKLYGA